MNKLKEFRNKVKKNNKGFSLVELIVVIVILAILIGVTIGGIYQYVNKSRVNTDINNAASIQSVIATVATDEKVNKELKPNQTVTIKWGDSTVATNKIADKAAVTIDTSAGAKTAVVAKVSELLPDGLPASKSNGSFKIEIKNEAGNLIATCKAYSDKACTKELGSEN